MGDVVKLNEEMVLFMIINRFVPTHLNCDRFFSKSIGENLCLGNGDQLGESRLPDSKRLGLARNKLSENENAEVNS